MFGVKIYSAPILPSECALAERLGVVSPLGVTGQLPSISAYHPLGVTPRSERIFSVCGWVRGHGRGRGLVVFAVALFGLAPFFL